MKIVVLIARILLGLIFVVFGLNPFLKYIPMQMPPGTAGQFLTVLFVSHFVYVVGAAQVIGGVLLLEQGKVNEAENTHLDGIRLRPKQSKRYEAYGDFLSDVGREDEAERMNQKAQELKRIN